MRGNISDIEAGVIWTFPGGIHPPERKQPASDKPLRRIALPQQLVLPLRQHIGQAGDLLVAEGDRVLKGQALTKPGLTNGLPVHAPTSATVIAIEPRATAHPSGLSELSIVLSPDGEERWIEKKPLADFRQHDRAELIAAIKAAGIAGLGGAGFPTAQKLAQQKPLDYLIINGVECEPYICADDRLMREHAEEILTGVDILLHITGIEKALIAIEDNKPEAIQAMRDAIAERSQFALRIVPTKYPSGGEKQLIQLLTGRQVPSKGLPMDIGLLMQNVGTAFAVKRAIIDGEPLLERVVTLTGEALQQPGCVWALLGTPIAHLMEQAGFTPDNLPRVIMGGPMMGFTLPALDVPVVKTTNCLLAPTEKELPPTRQELACIRCGACADVCPASLQPQQLQWLAKAKDYDALEQQQLFDCIECGACAYVCPSEIPLVHYYRKAKAEIKNIAREKAKAEIARERFEARQQRLEREKEERLERHRKAAEARQKAKQEAQQSGAEDPVQAALERVKRKKAEAANAEAPATNDKPQKSAAVAAAIARAKAKKAKQQAADAADNEKDES